MIRIAICDDDKTICEQLEKIISKFNVKYEYNLLCNSYTSCELLYQQICGQKKYNLIFLDIEFPQMNGNEFGDILRRCMKDFDTQIIFISAKQEYAMELFKIRPIEFLVKPIEEDRVITSLLNFLTYYESANQFLEYNYENIRHRIRVDEILYIQSERKKLQIHTVKQIISTYGKISDVVITMREHFIIIKRGVAVNIRHVVDSTSNDILLSNGEHLKISRGYQDEVRDRLAGLYLVRL